jgi:uncharacterized membrane protein YphA (DoxX/SURF4 family)
MRTYFPLIGRILFAQVFLISSFSKMADFEGTWKYMEMNGVPMAPLFLLVAILFEFGGGLSLLFGFQTKMGALMLILFLLPTTLIFHLDVSDPVQKMNLIQNFAILGGLFTILYHGGGPKSIDKEI